MITIWLPDDRPTLAMRVFGSTFVEEIKAQIEIESGIPQDQQRLSTGRHQLEDGRTMQDYNITDGTRIWCMLSIQGGGKVGSQRGGVKKGHLKDASSNSNATSGADRKMLLEARVRMSLGVDLPAELQLLQQKIKGIFDENLYFTNTIALADMDTIQKMRQAFDERSPNGGTFGRGLVHILMSDTKKWLVELTRVIEDAHELAYFREFWNDGFDNASFKKLMDNRESEINKQKMEEEITKRIAAALVKDLQPILISESGSVWDVGRAHFQK